MNKLVTVIGVYFHFLCQLLSVYYRMPDSSMIGANEKVLFCHFTLPYITLKSLFCRNGPFWILFPFIVDMQCLFRWQ